ncbi:hypothetical protein [Bacillus norwichensis]|uniref:Uncharacterized protein n=1 Tax=Bacillus norwichensis TaxID=2762217 RepID=A0ABR8VL47_9BACI|nr:hypothetical protein [Bacillus norwichensis]MBD8005151.1 hypothetical protein [Bacillus norwichensis]
MSDVRKWLREQRVPDAVYGENADAELYLRKKVEIVAERENIDLIVKETSDGFEVLWYDDIVWFGRDIDIDFLRTISGSTLEEMLEKRIERLREFRAPALELFDEYFKEEN